MSMLENIHPLYSVMDLFLLLKKEFIIGNELFTVSYIYDHDNVLTFKCVPFKSYLHFQFTIWWENGCFYYLRTPIAGTNYLKDYNMKSWAETPTEVKDDYGEEYFDTFLKEMEKALEMARPNLNEVS